MSRIDNDSQQTENHIKNEYDKNITHGDRIHEHHINNTNNQQKHGNHSHGNDNQYNNGNHHKYNYDNSSNNHGNNQGSHNSHHHHSHHSNGYHYYDNWPLQAKSHAVFASQQWAEAYSRRLGLVRIPSDVEQYHMHSFVGNPYATVVLTKDKFFASRLMTSELSNHFLGWY